MDPLMLPLKAFEFSKTILGVRIGGTAKVYDGSLSGLGTIHRWILFSYSKFILFLGRNQLLHYRLYGSTAQPSFSTRILAVLRSGVNCDSLSYFNPTLSLLQNWIGVNEDTNGQRK